MRPSFLFLLLHVGVASAATAAEWRGRSIYQVMTDRFALTNGSSVPCNTADEKYCGGTWQGIINKLDYIQGMGFSAIWISPITAQIAAGNSAIGDPYHGYYQTDIYALNPYFGTADDLKALSTALHNRGMYLMVDVVVNHFSSPGGEQTVNYENFVPFNDSSYFHPYCPVTTEDYTANQTAVEVCWLGNSINELVDVNTTSQDVIDIYHAWIKNLVSTYSIDGLRIDTVRNVDLAFWSGFNEAAGVYCVGEVDDGDLNYVCPYTDVLDGVVNYPMYFQLLYAMQQPTGNMTNLENVINGMKSACKDTTLLAPFAENHDEPRIPYYTSDPARDQNMIAFVLMADGIPIIYEGEEQYYTGGSDPANREAIWLSGYNTSSEFYLFVKQMVNLRNHAIAMNSNYLSYQQLPLYTDTHTIAMLKGFTGNQVLGVYSNLGSEGGSSTATIEATTFTGGTSLVEVVGCTTKSVNSDGSLSVTMVGYPQVYYAASNLAGSGICGK